MNGQHLYSAFLPSAALSPSAHFSCLITSFCCVIAEIGQTRPDTPL